MPRQNLIPNPALGQDATGWSLLTPGTPARVAVTGMDRSWAYQLTQTATGNAFIESAHAAVAPGPVTATIQWRSNITIAYPNVAIQINFYNSAGTFLSSDNTLATGGATANTAARTVLTATAPANTATATVGFNPGTTSTTGLGVFQATAARIEQVTDAALTYADGDTTGWLWTGTAESSTSSEQARFNLLPNPALGLNSVGWSSAGSPNTASRVSVTGMDRPYAWQVTQTAVGNCIGNSPTISVTPGVAYSATIQYRSTVTVSSGNASRLNFFDSSGSYIPTSDNTFTATANTPGRVTFTVTAPAGAATAYLTTIVGTTSTTGVATVQFTAARIEQSSDSALVYADGDTTGWMWTDVAESSTSNNQPPVTVSDAFRGARAFGVADGFVAKPPPTVTAPDISFGVSRALNAVDAVSAATPPRVTPADPTLGFVRALGGGDAVQALVPPIVNLPDTGGMVRALGAADRVTGAQLTVKPAFATIQVSATAAKQAAKNAGCTHVVIPAYWNQLQPAQGGALDATQLAALNAELDDCRTIGLSPILSHAIQYPPSWVGSAVEPFKDQAGNVYAGAVGSGTEVYNWMWTATGRGLVSDYVTKVRAGLSTANRAAVSRIRFGGGYADQLQYPPVSAIGGGGGTVGGYGTGGYGTSPYGGQAGSSLSYWGFGASMQSGTGLAAGLAVCPVPGYTPFTGTDAQDVAWINWYLDGIENWLVWYVATLKSAGWTVPLSVCHPVASIRQNQQRTDPGFRQALAAGQDFTRTVGRYKIDPLVWPWSTAITGTDSISNPVNDSDQAAWKKLYAEGAVRGKHYDIWGENPGGETNAQMDYVFANPLVEVAPPSGSPIYFGPNAPAVYTGYRGLMWLDYPALTATSGTGATLAHYQAKITAP